MKMTGIFFALGFFSSSTSPSSLFCALPKLLASIKVFSFSLVCGFGTAPALILASVGSFEVDDADESFLIAGGFDDFEGFVPDFSSSSAAFLASSCSFLSDLDIGLKLCTNLAQ